MIELLISISAFVVGYLLGWRLRELHAQRTLDSMFASGSRRINAGALHIEIFKENDYYYVYDSNTNAFLTQVKNKQELIDFFKTNHSDRMVTMKKDQLEWFEET